MKLAVCMKWVDTRPEVDPVTGVVSEDRRWFAASPADQSALETALSLGETVAVSEILVVCAGPIEADEMLRGALAAGATRAVRVDMDSDDDSADVANSVAPVVADCDLVVCGDWSLDRGSGSFPAFLAHTIGAAQALGCTMVSISDVGLVTATRRLDGGRREVLQLRPLAVVSVEAGAKLRRASLKSMLTAAKLEIEVVGATSSADPGHRAVQSGPFRPRSREIPPPEGDDLRLRLIAVSGAMVKPKASRAIHLDPEAAADLLLERLAELGVQPTAADS